MIDECGLFEEFDRAKDKANIIKMKILEHCEARKYCYMDLDVNDDMWAIDGLDVYWCFDPDNIDDGPEYGAHTMSDGGVFEGEEMTVILLDHQMGNGYELTVFLNENRVDYKED